MFFRFRVQQLDRVYDLGGIVEAAQLRRPHLAATDHLDQRRARSIVVQRWWVRRAKGMEMRHGPSGKSGFVFCRDELVGGLDSRILSCEHPQSPAKRRPRSAA